MRTTNFNYCRTRGDSIELAVWSKSVSRLIIMRDRYATKKTIITMKKPKITYKQFCEEIICINETLWPSCQERFAL